MHNKSNIKTNKVGNQAAFLTKKNIYIQEHDFLMIEKRSELFAPEEQGRFSDNTSNVYKNAVRELGRASEAYSRTNLLTI